MPDSPLWDSTDGDIRHATLTFEIVETGQRFTGVPVGLVNSADTGTGTVTKNVTVDIGKADAMALTVRVIVDGYYTAPVEQTVVTVAKPLTSSFISGGGYLLMAQSAGLFSGQVGTKNNIGFNVKYNKSGTNLQGSINTLVRNGGRTYQIKGNVMTSLATDPKTGTATFNGKASIQDVTDPLNPISIDGNATLQVTMTDRGEPGTNDSLGITVWNKSGGLWFSSSLPGPATAPASTRLENGDFDITLTIAPVEGARSKKKNERLWTYMADELSVSVTRDEATRPPDVLAVPGGGRDFTPRVPYFESRVRAYREAALHVLNNAISFLRYELHQPLLRSIGERSGQLSSPVWTDDEGQEIDPGVRTIVVRAVRGERSELGVVKFEAKHHKPFRAALTRSRPPRLYEEILSDAQAAAFDGNIRRAVLELAIACEVFVKHAFLGGGGSTALVYEALEDKGKLNARVLDLIEIGGTARLGKTFRTVDKDAYTDIDHLFRARNKIAHRGEAAFRDDAGHLHTVDSKRLARWWRSTLRLFAWAG